MSFAFQRRRGTTAQHSTFTGLLAELTVDTDKDTVIVHDGTTAGGFPLARESRGVLTETVTRGLEEDVNIVASAATGTINFEFATASIWYYTSNATANHTLNLRYSSSATLNNNLAVGDAITLVWLNTNGTSAFYPNVIQVDGHLELPLDGKVVQRQLLVMHQALMHMYLHLLRQQTQHSQFLHHKHDSPRSNKCHCYQHAVAYLVLHMASRLEL
jgi:hypothetical protein